MPSQSTSGTLAGIDLGVVTRVLAQGGGGGDLAFGAGERTRPARSMSLCQKPGSAVDLTRVIGSSSTVGSRNAERGGEDGGVLGPGMGGALALGTG